VFEVFEMFFGINRVDIFESGLALYVELQIADWPVAADR